MKSTVCGSPWQVGHPSLSSMLASIARAIMSKDRPLAPPAITFAPGERQVICAEASKWNGRVVRRRGAGARTAAHLFDLAPQDEVELDAKAVATLRDRLVKADDAMTPTHTSDAARLQKLRPDYADRLALLLTHLCAERTPLLPPT